MKLEEGGGCSARHWLALKKKWSCKEGAIGGIVALHRRRDEGKVRVKFREGMGKGMRRA
jgi:hypothetical protein